MFINANKKLLLLKLGEFYLVCDDWEINSAASEDADFIIHSHRCPADILSSVREVFDKTGKDPHGRIRLVAAIPQTEWNLNILDETDNLTELFELFQTSGAPIPSEWIEEE